MEKLNEMLIGTLAVAGAWLTKRIFNNHDTLSDRITALEKTVVRKEDLDPLERNTDMILTHILSSKLGPK
jgi:hypothetical protein